jgi:predicted dehydrogenase
MPKSMVFRINAGKLPKEHWVNDPEIGGGRIIGEICHFIDLAYYYAGSSVKSLYATEIKDADLLQDTLVIQLAFDNGSIASINYFSNGNKKLPKEYIEIYAGGITAVIDDFRQLKVFGNKISGYKLKKQDKGHRAEIEVFLDSIKKGKQSPIPFEDLVHTTAVTFMVAESLKKGQPVYLKAE